jgi:hypothetical protein
MKLHFTILIVFVASVSIVRLCEGSVRQKPDIIVENVKKIYNADIRARKEAFDILREERSVLVQELTDTLKNSKNTKSGDEYSSIHLSAALLGEWRAVEAKELLLDMIDYRLNLKAGAKYPLGYEFPCANALISIGGSEVLNAAISRIVQEPSLMRKRLFTWVVYSLVGVEVGVRSLEAAAKKLDVTPAKRLLDTREEISQENRLLFMLEEGN